MWFKSQSRSPREDVSTWARAREEREQRSTNIGQVRGARGPLPSDPASAGRNWRCNRGELLSSRKVKSVTVIPNTQHTACPGGRVRSVVSQEWSTSSALPSNLYHWKFSHVHLSEWAAMAKSFGGLQVWQYVVATGVIRKRGSSL